MGPLLNLLRKMAPNLGFALFLCSINSDNWGYLLISYKCRLPIIEKHNWKSLTKNMKVKNMIKSENFLP